MLNGLFRNMKLQEVGEDYAAACAEALENGEIRDMYMGCVSEALDIDFKEYDQSYVDESSLLDDQLSECVDMMECDSANCECGGGYEGEDCDDFDPNIASSIDALPESDPEDVGSYFSSGNDVSAECGGACESVERLIDMIPDTYINA